MVSNTLSKMPPQRESMPYVVPGSRLLSSDQPPVPFRLQEKTFGGKYPLIHKAKNPLKYTNYLLRDISIATG